MPARCRSMNDPLISVVLTLGGGVHRARTALATLREQTYQNWEAVVVDGCLAPDGDDTVRLLARDDSRVRLIHDPAARAVAAARDVAVRTSRGEWIAFLDSDERFLSHSLAGRLETARAHGLSVVHSDGYEITSERPVTLGVPPLAGWVYRDVLEAQGPRFPGLLIQRTAIADCGYLDGRLQHFQDWDLSIRLARGNRFGFEALPTFVGGQRSAVAASAVRGKAEEYVRVLRKHRAAMLQHGRAGGLGRHYRAAAELHLAAGHRRAAARCRAMVFLCGRANPARLLARARAVWSRQREGPGHARFTQQSHLEPVDVSLRLCELLRTPVRDLTSEFSEGQTGNVHRVQFRDGSGTPRRVVLKKVDSGFEYDFYRRVLEPLALDAPKMHGHVETSTGRFVVMDYVPHEPARWTDYDKHRTATRWLAKKDRIVKDNFQSILDARLMTFARDQPPLVHTIEDCIEILRKGVERNVSPLLSPLLLHAIVRRRQLLHELAAAVFANSRLTVCHRDFHLKNVLFPVDNPTSVYVIDWSNPEIDSVCVDLARLVLLAPPPVRRELIDIYRSSIDFEGFEESYRQAELIMTLVQFAWTFSPLLEARRHPFSPAELRKARALQRRLTEHLRLGLDEAPGRHELSSAAVPNC